MTRPFEFHRQNARAALEARRGGRSIEDLNHRQVEMFAHLSELDLEELSRIGKPQAAR